MRRVLHPNTAVSLNRATLFINKRIYTVASFRDATALRNAVRHALGREMRFVNVRIIIPSQ